jgi:pilus assembly protein TadC
MKTLPLIVIFVGLFALVLLYAVIGAVRGLFTLMAAGPFWAGLAAGIAISALIGYRIILRNRQLEAEKQQLEQAVDSFLQKEGAL